MIQHILSDINGDSCSNMSSAYKMVLIYSTKRQGIYISK